MPTMRCPSSPAPQSTAGSSPASIPATVQATLAELGAPDNVAVAPIDIARPTDASPLREDVVTAYTAAVRARHPGAAIIPDMSTGATDGLYFRARGVPVYGVDGSWAVIPADERAHGRDERLPVRAFYNDVDHWTDLVRSLAGGAAAVGGPKQTLLAALWRETFERGERARRRQAPPPASAIPLPSPPATGRKGRGDPRSPSDASRILNPEESNLASRSPARKGGGTAPMWMKLLIALGLAAAPASAAQEPHSAPAPAARLSVVPIHPYPTHILASADMRDRLDLSGAWHWSIDPYRDGVAGFHGDPAGYGHRRWEDVEVAQVERANPNALFEYDMARSPMVTLPSSWITQDPTLRHYDGLVWYQRRFAAERRPGRRAFLRFGAVEYSALVFLNGRPLGRHEGGFTPFAFEVTELLRDGDNVVTVGADSAHSPDTVPPPVTDWETYGGITRPVTLVYTPATYVDDAWVRLTRDGRIAVTLRLDGEGAANQAVRLAIPELGFAIAGRTDADGSWSGAAAAPRGLQRWSPESPRLYDVRFEAAGDVLRDRVGFRTVEVRGEDILLNGRPIFLRGISLHEEEIGAEPTRAITPAAARALLGEARDGLNANFVRLAHYPHSEVMTRMADELGLLVWSEIPVYWRINWDRAGTLAAARMMLTENILRDRNRASIILWSVGNETPVSEARNAFLAALVADVRRLDDSRLVTAALLNRRVEMEGRVEMVIDDPLIPHLDVMAVNTYNGWYSNDPLASLPGFVWRSESRQAADPVGVRRRRPRRLPRPGPQPALLRGISGRILPPDPGHGRPHPVPARHVALDPQGLPLAPPPAPGLPARLEPQGPDLRNRHPQARLRRAGRPLPPPGGERRTLMNAPLVILTKVRIHEHRSRRLFAALTHPRHLRVSASPREPILLHSHAETRRRGGGAVGGRLVQSRALRFRDPDFRQDDGRVPHPARIVSASAAPRPVRPYSAVGGKESSSARSTSRTPSICFRVSDSARGVTGASSACSVEKRTRLRSSRAITGSDQRGSWPGSRPSLCRCAISRLQKAATGSPFGVSTYSGRSGWPWPGLRAIQPASWSWPRLSLSMLRDRPSRASITAKREPASSPRCAISGASQRPWVSRRRSASSIIPPC